MTQFIENVLEMAAQPQVAKEVNPVLAALAYCAFADVENVSMSETWNETYKQDGEYRSMMINPLISFGIETFVEDESHDHRDWGFHVDLPWAIKSINDVRDLLVLNVELVNYAPNWRHTDETMARHVKITTKRGDIYLTAYNNTEDCEGVDRRVVLKVFDFEFVSTIG